MQFISLSDCVEQVTCVSLTHNKKFLFVFEQHRNIEPDHPNNDVFLSIYDIKGSEIKAQKLNINVSDLWKNIHNFVAINSTTNHISFPVSREASGVTA